MMFFDVFCRVSEKQIQDSYDDLDVVSMLFDGFFGEMVLFRKIRNGLDLENCDPQLDHRFVNPEPVSLQFIVLVKRYKMIIWWNNHFFNIKQVFQSLEPVLYTCTP